MAIGISHWSFQFSIILHQVKRQQHLGEVRAGGKHSDSMSIDSNKNVLSEYIGTLSKITDQMQGTAVIRE